MDGIEPSHPDQRPHRSQRFRSSPGAAVSSASLKYKRGVHLDVWSGAGSQTWERYFQNKTPQTGWVETIQEIWTTDEFRSLELHQLTRPFKKDNDDDDYLDLRDPADGVSAPDGTCGSSVVFFWCTFRRRGFGWTLEAFQLLPKFSHVFDLFHQLM